MNAARTVTLLEDAGPAGCYLGEQPGRQWVERPGSGWMRPEVMPARKADRFCAALVPAASKPATTRRPTLMK